MLDSTVELVLTHLHHLKELMGGCVLWEDTALLGRLLHCPVSLVTMCHLKDLSLNLIVYHVSLESSVLALRALLQQMNVSQVTIALEGRLQVTSKRLLLVITRWPERGLHNLVQEKPIRRSKWLNIL